MMSRKKLKKKVRKIKNRLRMAWIILEMWQSLAHMWKDENEAIKAVESEPRVARSVMLGEWQPIETLCKQNEQRGWVLIWSISDDRVREVWRDYYSANADYYIGDITHWMPLPEGPSEEWIASAQRSRSVEE